MIRPKKSVRIAEATFEVVEVMPEYPGGMEALIEYLGSNIKYPDQAKQEGIEGKVFVNFIVEKDGSIGETKVYVALVEVVMKKL